MTGSSRTVRSGYRMQDEISQGWVRIAKVRVTLCLRKRLSVIPPEKVPTLDPRVGSPIGDRSFAYDMVSQVRSDA